MDSTTIIGQVRGVIRGMPQQTGYGPLIMSFISGTLISVQSAQYIVCGQKASSVLRPFVHHDRCSDAHSVLQMNSPFALISAGCKLVVTAATIAKKGKKRLSKAQKRAVAPLLAQGAQLLAMGMQEMQWEADHDFFTKVAVMLAICRFPAPAKCWMVDPAGWGQHWWKGVWFQNRPEDEYADDFFEHFRMDRTTFVELCRELSGTAAMKQDTSLRECIVVPELPGPVGESACWPYSRAGVIPGMATREGGAGGGRGPCGARVHGSNAATRAPWC